MNKAVGILVMTMGVYGCSSNHTDIVSDQPAPGETLSPAEIRQVTVDTPFFTGADLFLQRSDKEAFDSRPGPDPEIEKKQADYERRIARLEQATAESQPSVMAPVPSAGGVPATVAGSRLPIKVGVAFNHAKVAPGDGERLASAFSKATAGLPVLTVAEEEIEQGLASARCPLTSDPTCAAKALAVYPGVRVLALIEDGKLPDRLPGEAQARVSLIDTGLAYRYPAYQLKARVTDENGAAAFAEQTAHSVLQQAVKRAAAMPWFTHSFSHSGERWHIGAGRASGLKPGDELWVLGPGEVVKAPSGAPAGWIPGERKGRLKVDKLFGRDFAACRLVEGKGPAADDFIVLPGPT